MPKDPPEMFHIGPLKNRTKKKLQKKPSLKFYQCVVRIFFIHFTKMKLLMIFIFAKMNIISKLFNFTLVDPRKCNTLGL